VEGFGDIRLIALGRRLIHEHRPDLLSENIRASIAAKMARRMTGEGHEATAWTTIATAHAEAVERLGMGNPDEAGILAGVLNYLNERMPDAEPVAAVG
jgi:hypothetical protein